MSDPLEADSEFLVRAFRAAQRLLEQQLGLSRETIPHPGVKGDVTEDHWISTLRGYLPRRYAVDKAIVVDSRGAHSDHIDVVVYDSQYTPNLRDQHRHRFIPAEAVYAVMECKPILNKPHLEYAGDKASSVRKLHRTSAPIHHADGTYPAKKLFEIPAGILAVGSDWIEGLGKTFSARLGELQGDNRIDFGCALRAGAFDRFDGELRIAQAEDALMWFLLRLLGKLQTLATVPAVDWNAYVSALEKG